MGAYAHNVFGVRVGRYPVLSGCERGREAARMYKLSNNRESASLRVIPFEVVRYCSVR